jgi:uncharacterized protein YjiS (DUF1127 family)
VHSAVAMPSRIEKELAESARALLASPNLKEHARRFVRWCLESANRRQQRRVLLTLDDRMLADIGVTRWEVKVEAAKPFWQM